MNNITVLHVLPSLGFGGAEKVIVDLSVALSKRGHKVVIASLSDRIPIADEAVKCGVEVKTLGFIGTIYSPLSLALAALKLRQIILTIRPHVINSHLYLADLLTRISAPLDVPVFCTLHNEDAWWSEPWRLRSRLKIALDRSLAAARGVQLIAVSDAIRSRAASIYAPRNKNISVIYNGVDVNKFPFRRRSSDSPIRIIQVGRFDQQKGHDVSVRALDTLVKSGMDLRLTFVGGGGRMDEIKDLVSSLSLGARVDFLGPTKDVVSELFRADIFWMPSNWEGLPIACMEAMATGVPVVVSRTGGLAELVDEQCGRLVNVGDWLELASTTKKLIYSPATRNQLAERARERIVSGFSVDNMANCYERLYVERINVQKA